MIDINWKKAKMQISSGVSVTLSDCNLQKNKNQSNQIQDGFIYSISLNTKKMCLLFICIYIHLEINIFVLYIKK